MTTSLDASLILSKLLTFSYCTPKCKDALDALHFMDCMSQTAGVGVVLRYPCDKSPVRHWLFRAKKLFLGAFQLIREIEIWGEDWGDDNYVSVIKEACRTTTFSSAIKDVQNLSGELEPSASQLRLCLWQLRRLFWLELIPTGRIRVRFSHFGESGEGKGPETLLRARGQEQISKDHGVWPEPDSIVYRPESFGRSDQLYMLALGEKFLEWPEFRVINLEEEEFDDDLFEHSFDSIDVLDVSESSVASAWKEVGYEAQRELLQNLGNVIENQIRRDGEASISPADIIAMAAAHPNTVIKGEDLDLPAELGEDFEQLSRL